MDTKKFKRIACTFIIVYFLTESKVNSLNEFKKQRSQLMEKFLRQEQELCELKKEKDNLIYDTDKKLIIVKEQ